MQDVTIDRLGRQGDGIAGDLRVPFTMPGERVRGPVEDSRLDVAQIMAASPDRVVPPCPHFGACGGCALQHASDGFLAGWKTDTIARALAARDLAAPLRPIAVSPPGTRRRATFAGRRSRKTVTLGFFARRSDRIEPIEQCALLAPEIMAAAPALRELVGLAASRARPVRLAITASEAGLDVEVRDGKPLDAALRTRLAELAVAHDLARLTWDGEAVAMLRPPLQRMGVARVAPPPDAFLQATPQGEAALVAAAREAVGDARRIADLFAGCGTFALPLAETAEVHAVEAAAPMLAALDAGWRSAPGLRRVTTERRDLFARPLLPAELARFDAVVIDPPRAGAEAQAHALAAASVARIAAVSCEPATFARDAAILVAGGYQINWVQPVDQFRWSGHVELAALFSRAA